MGARGPQPEPTALKKLRGVYRPDKANPAEPTSLGKPSCPPFLDTANERKEFRRLVKLLNNMGVVGKIDGNELGRHVVTWARWCEVVKQLRTAGETATLKSAKGDYVQISALHSAERSLSDQLRQTAAAFGMTPSARTRIAVNPAERTESPGSAVLAFIGRKNA